MRSLAEAARRLRALRLSRLPRRIPVIPALITAIVLAAAVAGAGWYAGHRHLQRDTAVRQSLAAAPAAAKAIFSYDYRTYDDSVANGRTFATGAFAEEYAQTTATLKETAAKQQAVVLAEVSSTGVVSATADRVELLVYLNQYRRNVSTAGEKVDQNRVVLTMVLVDGDWKVVQAVAI
jgi:Mce-associated membrane protein